ncbi:MAG: PD40 domain-containing protein [Acidobacteriia bacterium]|nr:PD40 domain-containing protein [Terriglobia bacterium]
MFGSPNLQRVPAGGGEPKPLLKLDQQRQEIRQFWPWFLPDGNHFVYLSQSTTPGKTGIYLGSLDSEQSRLLMPGDSNAIYAAPGFLLFGRQQTLLARAFDADKLEFTGDPFPLAERVGAMQVLPGSLFSVSQNGVLVSRPPLLNVVQLAWHGRNGQRLAPVGEPGEYRQMVLAPDQDRLFVERPDPKTTFRDVWMLVMASGIFSRITLTPGTDQDPVLSPNGRELFFSSNRNGRTDLYKKVIGGGEDELILSTQEAKYPEQVLKDGSILFINSNGKSIFRLPPASAGPNRKPELLFQTGFESDEPQVSPDSRWITYSSNESGRWEIYVASFPSFADKRQVSNSGGYQPKWRKDGKELFYLTQDGKLMVVEVNAGGALAAGTPKLLFQTPVKGDWRFDQYAVSGDGQRFIYGEPMEQEEKPIHVVLHWPAGVKQ